MGGWALYKLYHTRWWDYSDFPFNIGGYICLEFCLLWGVGTLVVMRIVHPVVADLVALIPLDTMEQLGDSIHAVSDAMTQLLGTTTLNADQKLDEGRLQFKLAAAEARDAAEKRPSARETLAAIRAKAAEASEAAHPPHRGPAPYAARLPEAPARQKAAHPAHIAGDAAPRRTGKQGRQQETQMTPNAAPALPCVAFLLRFARIMLL